MKNLNKNNSHKHQLSRLKRLEGQVRGIIGMVEEQRYCVDILTQIKAVKGAISRIEGDIIEKHLDHCVATAINSKTVSERSKVIEEIRTLLK